jgi:hypothetical protein
MEFYSEPIAVTFESEPLLEKRPGLPAAFIWRENFYKITKLIKEWHDYTKRGKMEEFYSENVYVPQMKSEKRGSWGVGRDYYRVLTDSGEIFDIYYDRKPVGQKRKGEWILLKKVGEE